MILLVILLLIGAPDWSTANDRRSDYCQDCIRDKHGKIARSQWAKQEFKRQSGFPSGRPGYQIDHIIPLACGGPDTPTNMQWLSLDEKRVKDRNERKECLRL